MSFLYAWAVGTVSLKSAICQGLNMPKCPTCGKEVYFGQLLYLFGVGVSQCVVEASLKPSKQADTTSNSRSLHCLDSTMHIFDSVL